MSARLRAWGACRALSVRSKPAVPKTQPFLYTLPRRQWYSDDKHQPTRTPIDAATDSTPSAPQSGAPKLGNGQTTASLAGNGVPPTPTEQPSQDAASYLNAGTNAPETEHLDDATLEQIFYGGRTNPTEADGGLTEAQEDVLYREGTIPAPSEAEALVAASETAVGAAATAETPGLKFPLPTGPFGPEFNQKKRYHPVVDQLTRLLMRDGKLGVAQRNIAMVMNYLRTSPAPIYSPKFPLLPGTPPASHLPLNPVLYMTIAVDSVAPVIKVRALPGAAGGGRALDMPQPLDVRQRRRAGFQWILDVVEKKQSKGSGRKQFPHRIAEEIVAVVEGRSSVWDKRRLVHKQGTAARANINARRVKQRKVT